jgi:heme/copper-type cytochrome/quinol oxidase subunit 3
MSADTEFHVHHDAPEVVGRRERLGVRLLIVADGAFVFGLIFSYFYLRNLNANNGWLPKGAHHYTAISGWWAALPLVLAALSHRFGMKQRSSFGVLSILTFILLLVGGYYQWHQVAHMPFITKDTGVFEGSYASMWMIIACANLFHYIVGTFIALGLAIRNRRVQMDAVLETWRLRIASTWFTWIAISGLACALTMTFIK